jgi:FkbM family methyltransferase
MSDEVELIYPPGYIRMESVEAVSDHLTKINLPGGFSCYSTPSASSEAEMIYNEVMVNREYLQHGLSLDGACCVMDVGGNIGLFTMFVKLQAPGAAVYAFEPIQKTFQVLEQNVRLLDCPDVHLYNLAVGSQDHTEIMFTFFPNMPGNTTANPALKDDVRPVMDQLFGKKMSDVLYQTETCVAQVRTLSSIFREQGISSVDYLKIDVEGSEIAVLEGIEDLHWPMIRQVAIETHTAALREQVCETLAQRGFEIFTEVGLSSPMGVAMVYARRL